MWKTLSCYFTDPLFPFENKVNNVLFAKMFTGQTTPEMQMDIPENSQRGKAPKGFPSLFCGSQASGGEFSYKRIEERINLNNTVILPISVLFEYEYSHT